jgi:hypothetical protein
MTDPSSEDLRKTKQTDYLTVTPEIAGEAHRAFGASFYILGVLWWFVVGIGVACMFSASRAFLAKRWWVVLIAAVVLVVIMYVPAVQKSLRMASAQKKTGVAVFGVIPVVLIILGVIVVLPPDVQVIIVRVVFLLPVCLLPATIYYLFLATRKTGLLSDYVANLDQLGLLAGRRKSDPDYQFRIMNYLQKFEVLYGPLPEEMKKACLSSDTPTTVLADPSQVRTLSLGLVQCFTSETAIPVFLVTILVGLGWLLILPPRVSGTGANLAGTDQLASSAPPLTVQTNVGGVVTSNAPAPILGGSESRTNANVVGGMGQQSLTDASLLNSFKPVQTPVTFAFLGAYFFSIQMLFRRFVREDLRRSAYVAVALRIILAVIGTWAAVAAISWVSSGRSPPGMLALVGFAIGVFPRLAWQLIQGICKKIPGVTLALPSLETQLPLSDLDGLTVWHESRLEEEDVENIPNMATADIVDLMLSTRFPPDRIVDWMDQAILYTHLGPDPEEAKPPSRRDALRAHGIRTASSLLAAYRNSKPEGDQMAFEAILSADHRSPIRSLVDALMTNPTLEHICVWRGMPFLPPNGPRPGDKALEPPGSGANVSQPASDKGAAAGIPVTGSNVPQQLASDKGGPGAVPGPNEPDAQASGNLKSPGDKALEPSRSGSNVSQPASDKGAAAEIPVPSDPDAQASGVLKP